MHPGNDLALTKGPVLVRTDIVNGRQGVAIPENSHTLLIRKRNDDCPLVDDFGYLTGLQQGTSSTISACLDIALSACLSFIATRKCKPDTAKTHIMNTMVKIGSRCVCNGPRAMCKTTAA